jgi:hypothetical protein
MEIPARQTLGILAEFVKWDWFQVVEKIAGVLADAEAALRLEQAVYGLDAREEREIQALLADGLVQSYDVAREVHYPSSAGKKLSHRMRCDLVLTPKGRPLRLDSRPAGLFDPVDACPPGDGLWLEVKCAYQFREGGERHGGYGQQWRSAVMEDLRKMEAEPMIREAGLVLIVFNESHAIIDKDLELFENVLAEKEVLAGFRQVQSVPIVDRIGHRLCTVAAWPTIQR